MGSRGRRAIGRLPNWGNARWSRCPDRMRWALVMCGADDPLRADLSPAAVTRAARRVIAALTDVVPSGPAGERRSARLSIAVAPGAASGAALAVQAVGSRPVAPCEWTAALDAALILMADHELATSTVAVRVAASHQGRSLRRARWPGWPRWPGRCTGRPARVPTSCWSPSSVTVPPGPSTTSCTGTTISPGSGTRSTRRAIRGSSALWDLARPLLTRGAVQSLPRDPRAGRGRRRAAAELRPGPGRPELGHGHATRRRTHHLHRGPHRRVDGPLPGGAAWSARCASGPGPSTASEAPLSTGRPGS